MTGAGTSPTWTTERVARLKSLMTAGFSCAQIAHKIGVSRNAVIGKANRLRLSRFDKPLERERTGTAKITRTRAFAGERIFAALRTDRELAVAGIPDDGAKRCSLSELERWHCRWPIGDPCADDFAFCGNRSVGDLPYCAAHARLAYRPANIREHRAPSRRL